MCTKPLTIPNPNFGMGKIGLGFLKDTSCKYITIPCGHCDECIRNKQMQMIQRVQMEELENHLFFCTLTYNSDMIPVVSTSTGYDIRYADVSDVQKMMKRLSLSNAFGRPFRYLAVSELGSKKGRPHPFSYYFLPS